MVGIRDIFLEAKSQRDDGNSPIFHVSAPSISGKDIIAGAWRAGLRVVNGRDGPIGAVEEGPDPADLSRQTSAFGWHKDGLYLPDLPTLVCLYCLNPGRGDSPTVIANCANALDLVDIDTRQKMDTAELVYLSSVGEMYPRRLVERPANIGRSVVHIGERVLVRQVPHVEGELGLIDGILETTRGKLDDSTVHTQFWKAGDFLLFDNISYAHARRAIWPDPLRRLVRIWLS